MTHRPRGARFWNAVLPCCAALLIAGNALCDWPEPAVRSGTTLPRGWRVAVTAEAGGVYVPKIRNLSAGETGIFEGSLVWNWRLIGELGLFGRHAVDRMWWDNVSILTLNHEVGARFRCFPFLVFEYAYLGHRTEKVWIASDGESGPTQTSPGGVYDHGGEVGIWGRWDPLRILRIEGHLFGRAFRVFKDDQDLLGIGLRLSVMPRDGHAIVLEVQTLGVYRAIPRPGVDRTTWNTFGTLLWRSNLTSWVGIQVGARVSTHWWCGEVPMLELKRSMIDEPTAAGFVGFYFFV